MPKTDKNWPAIVTIWPGNVWEHRSYCWKAAKMHGNDIPIIKVFKNSIMEGLRTISWPKYTRLQDFA